MDNTPNKFAEISPVLELIYVMLTNMTKYLNVYAKDIDASKLVQYQEAKTALTDALKKFDAFYGLESNTEVGDGEPKVVDPVPPMPSVPAPTTANKAAPTFNSDDTQFTPGNDKESLEKAKKAVSELKELFADMKKEEKNVTEESSETVKTVATTENQSSSLPPITGEEQAPSVSAIPSGTVAQEQAVPQVPPVVTETTQPVVDMAVPTPQTPVAQPPKEDKEIDSILAELRKLQKKGGEL